MTSLRNTHQLLLVKQLYEDARLLAERDDTFSHTKAVILLDLAVEAMLNSIVLNFDPDLTVNASKGSHDTDRKTLWGNAATALGKAKNRRLVESREMSSLHTLRNLVQHNGTEPTQTEARRYVAAAELMLGAAFRDAYDLDFINYRVWDLVPSGELRDILSDSERALDGGRPEICIFGCNQAWSGIVGAIRDHTKHRRARLSASAFRRSGGQVSVPARFPPEVARQIERTARQADKALRDGVDRFGQAVMREIEFLEDEVVTIGVGMPLMETRRFEKIGDGIFVSMEGTVRALGEEEEGEREELAKGARFMLNYLSRLVRLVDEAYPGLLGEVQIRMPLREQTFWKEIDPSSFVEADARQQEGQ